MGERLKMVYQPAKKIGIEIFPPYVCQFWTEARAIHGDMREWWRWIDDSECDTAMMIDTIEHIPKNDWLKLIASLQAKFKRILVFTPSGFYLQDSDPTGNDNEYQVHESGWTNKELEDLGFSVIEDPNFHEAKECGALFGVWTREQ